MKYLYHVIKNKQQPIKIEPCYRKVQNNTKKLRNYPTDFNRLLAMKDGIITIRMRCTSIRSIGSYPG